MILALYKRFLRISPESRSDDGQAEPLDLRLERIQQGDWDERNRFVAEYQPFVAKAASRLCKRYIDPSRDDEFSIALAAFDEAITQYSVAGGRSFFSFAEMVIRRRLIDYIRKEKRHASQIPYSAFDIVDNEENVVNPVDIHVSLKEYQQQAGIEERRSEIVELNRHLNDFGIQFADLVKAAPKHEDSRRLLFAVGKILAGNKELMNLLMSKRMLPIKELLGHVRLSRKTLERNRKYIIAVALIHSGSYPHLRDYLKPASPIEEKKV